MYCTYATGSLQIQIILWILWKPWYHTPQLSVWDSLLQLLALVGTLFTPSPHPLSYSTSLGIRLQTLSYIIWHRKGLAAVSPDIECILRNMYRCMYLQFTIYTVWYNYCRFITCEDILKSAPYTQDNLSCMLA